MNEAHLIMIGQIPQVPPQYFEEYQNVLKTLTSSCSKKLRSDLLSPFSVTIDHEFLGVPSSLQACIHSVFCLEETIVEWNVAFDLSYVILNGAISTPIQKKTSSQLMGEGVSQARKALNQKKSSHNRILFYLQPEHLCDQLNNLFMVLDSISSSWNQKDFPLISDMLQTENNEEVAIKHRKNRSQIWKRRKTLQISEYKALKHVLLNLNQN
ncbi:MAG: hypothetical protein GF421_04380 [Candidatus Aminicenantes bacterium]|nr:hypothetical protein [Candidatus Aminicenantes bacterium]